VFAVTRVDPDGLRSGVDKQRSRGLDIDGLPFDDALRRLDADALAERQRVLAPPIHDCGFINEKVVERFEQPLSERASIDITDLFADARRTIGELADIDIGVDTDADDDPRDAIRFTLHLGEDASELFVSLCCRHEHVVWPLDPGVDASFSGGSRGGDCGGKRHQWGVRWGDVGSENGADPDTATRCAPLAIEPPPATSLLVGEDDEVFGTLACRLPCTVVRAPDRVVIFDLERRVESILDSTGAELGDRFQPVAVVAVDDESLLTERLDVLPDRRASDVEAFCEIGTGDCLSVDRFEDGPSRVVHTWSYTVRANVGSATSTGYMSVDKPFADMKSRRGVLRTVIAGSVFVGGVGSMTASEHGIEIVELEQVYPPATPGGRATIEITLENTADEVRDTGYQLRLDGWENTPGLWSIEANDQVTFEDSIRVPDEPGEYEAVLAIDEDDPLDPDDIEASTTVTVGEDADGGEQTEGESGGNFVLHDLDPGDTRITTGQQFLFSATVENVGEEAGTATVRLQLDGGEVPAETTEVTLDPGESETVSNGFVPGEPAESEYGFIVSDGEYDVTDQMRDEHDQISGELIIEDEDDESADDASGETDAPDDEESDEDDSEDPDASDDGTDTDDDASEGDDDTDDETVPTESEDGDDELPGPGITGALTGVGGALVLLQRRLGDRFENE